MVGSRLGEKGALFAAVGDGSATECRQGPRARGACDSPLGIGMGRLRRLIGQLGLGQCHPCPADSRAFFMYTNSNPKAVTASFGLRSTAANTAGSHKPYIDALCLCYLSVYPGIKVYPVVVPCSKAK